MVKQTRKNGKKVFFCEDCGLHYIKEEIANKCENWCKSHKSCNMEIIKQSIEMK